jgi:S-adenosyl-L-methionine hydrolase (adenosine-forming)
MNERSIISLLTDFGTADAYVAAMKGVILSLAPQVTVVDASHDIPPQDIRAGAWVLGQFWNCYPAGTIHVGVVDPGVGTERDALLIEADGHWFLAPDNGLLSWVLKQAKQVRLRKLRADVHRPGEVASTFHGRDVFAHAAGMLASGRAKPEELSDETNSVIMPSWAIVQIETERIVGEVVHIDRFGNLITNIQQKQVDEMGWKSFLIQAGPSANIRLHKTYGDAKSGELIALWGSSKTLEIAVSGGSAEKKTHLTRGALVVVCRNHSD